MAHFLRAIDFITLLAAYGAVLLPLLAFVINICLPGKTNKISGWVSSMATSGSLILAIFVFARVWDRRQMTDVHLWFTIGNTKIYAGIFLNSLSSLMLLLVSVIALPVHIYSMAYMKHDGHYKRYFTYLSLFCFSMLGLVIAENLILVYAFWELVGFSSYLLIGFWYTKPKAIMANKKAFIMNRIGDIGLLTAIIILFAMYHTFDLTQLVGVGDMVRNSVIHNGLWSLKPDNMVNPGIAMQLPAVYQYIAVAGIILAVAAKSAQFPLHTWLPDAMEGPTSVSALIHAATMVAAGVFLLGRMYPLFNSEELTLLAVIGCFTAFMAATIALTQNDLKRILAYSTISQLGFMIMAMGIGAYASSLFHLVTHAFFKCLLFLVAGIVIHEMQHIKDENQLDIDPQNILNMGGLRKKMPLTFIACLIGGLALVGLPLTSGYLSKDGILIQSFEWADGKGWLYELVPIGALITSWLTAFYVARLIFKVFFGEFRLTAIYPNIKLHISDGGWQYKLPLIFLALCSLFPLFSWNPFSYEHSWIFRGLAINTVLSVTSIYHTIIPVGLNAIAILVIWWAYGIYAKQKISPFSEAGFFYKISYNEWYIDHFYQRYIVAPFMVLSRASRWADINIIDGFIHLLQQIGVALGDIAKWMDKYIIDGFLHLLAAIVLGIGSFARSFQSGKIQYYLFSMLAVILAVFIFKMIF